VDVGEGPGAWWYVRTTLNGTMRHARWSVVAASLVTVVACTGAGSPVGSALASGEPSGFGSVPPTGPAGRATPLTSGRADATLHGDLDAVRTYASLSTPTIYTPDAGAVTLTWRTDLYESLSLAGSVAPGERPTSTSLQLQFTVQRGSQLIAFASQTGECRVRIDALDETTFRGSFDCVRLTSVDGGRTVDASGSFEASA
jgi:hypothetical protein